MAIKNAYSKINTAQLFQNLQKILAAHGATKMMFDYGNNGKIEALTFAVKHNEKLIPIILPAKVNKVQTILEEQGIRCDDDHAYRVAWRNIYDWVDAQFALIETDQATLPQVFLPYIVTGNNETMIDRFNNNQLLLEGEE